MRKIFSEKVWIISRNGIKSECLRYLSGLSKLNGNGRQGFPRRPLINRAV